MTRPMNILRTWPGKKAFGRGLSTVLICLSKCARFRSNPEGLGKLMQSKSGQAPKEMTERQNWIQDKFNFLKTHIRCMGLSKSSAFKFLTRGANAMHLLPQHTTFQEVQLTRMVWRSACDQTLQYSLQVQANQLKACKTNLKFWE